MADAAPEPRPEPKPDKGQRVESPDDLITVVDISRRLRVDKRTIQRWVKKGYLPAPVFQIGNCRRWLRSDIEGWVRYHQKLKNVGRPGERKGGASGDKSVPRGPRGAEK